MRKIGNVGGENLYAMSDDDIAAIDRLSILMPQIEELEEKARELGRSIAKVCRSLKVEGSPFSGNTEHMTPASVIRGELLKVFQTTPTLVYDTDDLVSIYGRAHPGIDITDKRFRTSIINATQVLMLKDKVIVTAGRGRYQLKPNPLAVELVVPPVTNPPEKKPDSLKILPKLQDLDLELLLKDKTTLSGSAAMNRRLIVGKIIRGEVQRPEWFKE